MTEQRKQKQDLVKLRDKHFQKALTSKDEKEKVQALLEAIYLSKSIVKASDNFHVWIEYKGQGLNVNGDEFTEVKRVY